MHYFSGSRGIGKAIAERLVNEGTKVYAIGKTRENLDKLKAEVPTVNLIQVNISDWDKTKTVLEQIGTVDLLVNNAAITGDGKFIDAEKELLNDVINTNCKSVFNIPLVVARGLIAA
ncbi:hypothetical protein KUTeg_005905 [Tegillarca granosa]|uniref:Uncharacterized protein n=1 Tax=Tegillarca granosa TaxID=220873 RepID=A0ABQ9FGT5_TEGGR|nr:hypothetical protein KUTeg_005905 [Tegillarca granosa]